MEGAVVLDTEPGYLRLSTSAKDGGKLSGRVGMSGADLTSLRFRKVPSDMLAFKVPDRGSVNPSPLGDG